MSFLDSLVQMDDDAGDGEPYVIANFMHLNAGERVPPHNHDWPHMTIIARGSALFRQEGGKMAKFPREGMNFDCVRTPAGVEHEIIAVEDGTLVICVNRSERLERHIA